MSHSGDGAVRAPVVHLVQQGIWATPLESMPLAAPYLKATALDDARIRDACDIRIHNFRGGASNAMMANELFGAGVPDLLAFSVLGWNYRAFGALAETFKQLNPSGWVVFGGTHVSGQADRVFRMFGEVDLVVNGEGEPTFRDVLHHYLHGVDRHELYAVPGVSFRTGDGATWTTAPRDRIVDRLLRQVDADDAVRSPALQLPRVVAGAAAQVENRAPGKVAIRWRRHASCSACPGMRPTICW